METIWNSDNHAESMLFKTAIDALGLSDLTMYQSRHGGASIDKKQSLGDRLFSPSPVPKQVRNTHATCRGIADKAFADPVVHKCMTGK